MNGDSTQNPQRSAEISHGPKQRLPHGAKGQASSGKVPRLQKRYSGDGAGSDVSKVRRGSRSASVLQVRGPSRSHHDRGFDGDALSEKRELILRSGFVRIESLPDDFRQAPLDYNLRQTLIIPDRAKEPSRLAKVLALGSEPAQDGVHYPFTVAIGDIVLCNRYPKSFQGFHWGEEKVAVVSETEILAVVSP